eukprot:6204747-Pleurochrysis_carterae.AAC.4
MPRFSQEGVEKLHKTIEQMAKQQVKSPSPHPRHTPPSHSSGCSARTFPYFALEVQLCSAPVVEHYRGAACHESTFGKHLRTCSVSHCISRRPARITSVRDAYQPSPTRACRSFFPPSFVL